MQDYEQLKTHLRDNPKTWLITGVAGFIGSNLLEILLLLNQRVIGLDNFSTGFQKNLDEVRALVLKKQWKQSSVNLKLQSTNHTKDTPLKLLKYCISKSKICSAAKSMILLNIVCARRKLLPIK